MACAKKMEVSLIFIIIVLVPMDALQPSLVFSLEAMLICVDT